MPDGSIRWIDAHGRYTFDAAGRAVRTVGVCRDITAPKQAEEALRLSEARLKQAQSLGHMGSFSHDLTTGAIWWSDEAYRLAGLEPAAGVITFDQIRALVHPDDRARWEAASQSAWAKDQTCVSDHRVVWPDGSIRYHHVVAEVQRGPNGRPVEIIGTVQDVTEQKLAEQQLADYQERLRRLAARLTQTEEEERRRIAGDLHDAVVQTLAVARMKLQALLSGKPAALATTSMDEVLGLVDQAMRESRSLVFDLSPPLLHELGLEPAIEWLAQKIEREHGLPITFQADGRPKLLAADVRDILFGSVRELLLNAVSHARAGRITIESRLAGDRIQVVVSDDGVGFDPRKVLSVKRPDEGLGLFHIRERMDHVGGALSVLSAPGRGTRVTLTAQVLEPPAAT